MHTSSWCDGIVCDINNIILVKDFQLSDISWLQMKNCQHGIYYNGI